MSTGELSTIFQSTTALLILVIVVFKFWPCYRLDSFRQSMFALRGELFDYAASGKIAFQHPAHRLLRQSMNGFIRYAHHLTFFRLIMTLLIWKFSTEQPALNWARKWDSAVNSVEDDTIKQELRYFHARALGLVVKRLVTGSPILLCLVGTIVAITVIRVGWHNLKQVVRTTADQIVSKIVDPRLLEEEAARLAA